MAAAASARGPGTRTKHAAKTAVKTAVVNDVVRNGDPLAGASYERGGRTSTQEGTSSHLGLLLQCMP